MNEIAFFHSNCIVWFNYLKNKLKNIEEDAGIAIGLLCTAYFCDMNYLNVGVRKKTTRRGYWDGKLHACVAVFNDKVLFICLIYLLSLSTLFFCTHIEAMFTWFTDFYYCCCTCKQIPNQWPQTFNFSWMYVYMAFSCIILYMNRFLAILWK